MAKQKRIRCFCHGPIAAGPQYKSPWEDVWLRWKGKPGRRVYHAAPCLSCSAEIQPELDSHQRIRDRDEKADPVKNLVTGLDLPEVTKEERASWYLEDDARLRTAQKTLETQPYYVDPPWPGKEAKHLEQVYTNAKGIDRAEAERMLAFYLAEVFGIKNPKFVWARPEMVIIPTGFGDYGD